MERLIERLCGAQGLAKLIGEAPAFLKGIEQLPAVAKSDATVLITGETGTIKERVARAIHYLSKRAAFPFIPVNCPDMLLEEEIFGHEREAFTNSHSQRRDLMVLAEKGTLFLDGVEALTSKAQSVLLRLLQDKKFRASSSSCEQQADVRIVAATNVPLDQRVRAGSFRPDLYDHLSQTNLIEAKSSHLVKSCRTIL